MFPLEIGIFDGWPIGKLLNIWPWTWSLSCLTACRSRVLRVLCCVVVFTSIMLIWTYWTLTLPLIILFPYMHLPMFQFISRFKCKTTSMTIFTLLENNINHSCMDYVINLWYIGAPTSCSNLERSSNIMCIQFVQAIYYLNNLNFYIYIEFVSL